MRILIILNIGRTAFELGHYCKKAFEEMGHSVATFLYNDTRFSRRFHVLSGLEGYAATRMLFSKIGYFRPDFIFIIKVDRLLCGTINRIRQRFKIPVVQYWIDDPYYIDVSRKISPCCDIFFTNDENCIETHRQSGAGDVRLMSFGCEPALHNRLELNDEEKKYFGSEICFSGTLTQERLEVLEALAGFDIKIWAKKQYRVLCGNYRIEEKPVPQDSPVYSRLMGRDVWGLDMVKAFNASKIVLDIHTQDTPTMRDFEVPGCGGFLLSDHVRGLDKVFIPGKEIECFGSIDELKEKISHYLENEDERKQIADRGYIRAHRQYTYKERMKQVMDALNEEG